MNLVVCVEGFAKYQAAEYDALTFVQAFLIHSEQPDLQSKAFHHVFVLGWWNIAVIQKMLASLFSCHYLQSIKSH